MKITILFSLILFSLTSYSQIDTLCKCCTEQHHQFDFWIGDWNVYDTTGNLVGENQIKTLQNGCALQEKWKSKNLTGTSVNYFNATDNTWNQVWIDNKGGTLALVGNFENNVMTLRSKLLSGVNNTLYRNEISWTPHKDGSVTQLWNIVDEQGMIVNRAFHGIYRRK